VTFGQAMADPDFRMFLVMMGIIILTAMKFYSMGRRHERDDRNRKA
jgi:hypothetical protein